MNIIFYNCAHIGDLLFSKSFIKQFCDNNNNFNISYVMDYNSFLFSDINNLNIIIPNNDIDNKYNNDFNGYYDPIKSINITNNLYIQYINFFKNNFDNINYTIHNNNIYIKLWICDCTSNYNSLDLECNIININNYYNNIINNINFNYGFNIKLITNLNLLPDIPYTNIDKFLLFRKSTKKIIFYYNYNPNSNQNINTNHENNLMYLSQKYNNYIICCAVKPIYNSYNIISMDDFGYIKSPSCENIAKTLYCAMNSDIVFTFDIGACFYLCNPKFNQIFKGIWYHISNNDYYYKKINDVLNNNKFLLLNSDITSYI